MHIYDWGAAVAVRTSFLRFHYLLPRRKLDNIMSNGVSRYDGGHTKVDLTIYMQVLCAFYGTECSHSTHQSWECMHMVRCIVLQLSILVCLIDNRVYDWYPPATSQTSFCIA